MAEWTIARWMVPIVAVADLACMNWLWVATIAVWMIIMKGVFALGGK